MPSLRAPYSIGTVLQEGGHVRLPAGRVCVLAAGRKGHGHKEKDESKNITKWGRIYLVSF